MSTTNNDTEFMNVRQSIDLSSFQRAKANMIATNEQAYQNFQSFYNYHSRIKEYSLADVERIISSGSLSEQQRLSRNYFNKDGVYRQIIIYYGTLLKYSGLLVPNPANGKKLSTSHIQKRYFNAIDYIDKMNLPSFLTNCAIRALVDGCYYGIIVKLDRNAFTTLDLPNGYCRTNFKDIYGNDIIEFDVTYFNTIFDKTKREEVLKIYPKVVQTAYKQYQNNKKLNKWVIIPSDIGICFPLFDARPFFLSLIPATIKYDKAVDIEQERELEEIRKILVQKIPHLNEGRLLFEPDEAEEIHKGAVGMLKGNKNISVLTTYADVDAIVSKTSNDAATNTLEKMQQHVYTQAGVSGQLFAATSSSSINLSVKKDIAFMMVLGNKFATFVTNIINELYSNSNIDFKFIMLNVSYQTEKEYIDMSFKLASSGYSLLLPALALGLNQRDLGNTKDLENEVLALPEKLLPLKSSYTQTDKNPVGRPALAQEDKSEKTIKNEESLDRNGGTSDE